MKISERSQPILIALKNKSPETLQFPSLEIIDELNEAFPSIIEDLEIDLITDTFAEATHKSFEAIRKANLLREYDGGFIHLTSSKQTFILKVIKNKKRKLEFYTMWLHDNIILYSGIGIIKFDLKNSANDTLSLDENGFWKELTEEFTESYSIALRNHITMNIFKKYSEIKTIQVKKNTVKKINFAKKIANQSGVDVNYLDITWFTNIVRSEGFSVRGHFRLQRYKNDEGEWYRKLIWIDNFEKKGYTRKAKKLNQEKK